MVLAGWQLHTQALPTGEELICSLATHTQGFFQRGARRNVVVALLDSLGLVAEGDGGVLIFFVTSALCVRCAPAGRTRFILSYRVVWATHAATPALQPSCSVLYLAYFNICECALQAG